jgi:hypothetical protein
MREIPILFSTPMVQAILAGKKTMTRRICKDIAGYDFKWGLDKEPYIGNYKIFAKTESGKWDWVTLENQWLYDLQTAVDDNRTHLLKCPYGQPGDRLWVRETWADNIPGCPNGITYKADHIDPKGDGPANPIKWKPSIFMPKAAARIWLEVVSVRIERLQEITEDDARAEGIIFEEAMEFSGWRPTYNDPDGSNAWPNYKGAFNFLWDSLNAKRGYGWDSNPFVWAISFKTLEGGKLSA